MQVAAPGVVFLIASALHVGATGVAIALVLALVVIDAIITPNARPRPSRTPAIPG